MDSVTRAFYELKFENAYLTKKGDAFQDFFASIMEKRHPGDFIRVRPWGRVGDRKNDGFLRSQRTLFQVYGPNDLAATETLAKINEDFSGALPYWLAHFDVWVFVHNSRQGLGPDVTARLLELNGPDVRVESWGYEELRQRVFELGQADIASLLGLAPSRRDMLDLGLDTLAPILDHLAIMPAPERPDLRPPPADKITRNMLSPHVEVLLKTGMSRAELARMYFRVQPNRRDEIAESFRRRYDRARQRGLAPDEVFVDLQRYASGDEVPTAARQSGVLAVLAYFFEECDIFEREPNQGGPI